MIFLLEQTPEMKKSIMLLKFHHFPMFLKFLPVFVTFFPYFTRGYKGSLGPFKISRFTRNFKIGPLDPLYPLVTWEKKATHTCKDFTHMKMVKF